MKETGYPWDVHAFQKAVRVSAGRMFSLGVAAGVRREQSESSRFHVFPAYVRLVICVEVFLVCGGMLRRKEWRNRVRMGVVFRKDRAFQKADAKPGIACKSAGMNGFIAPSGAGEPSLG